MVEQTFDNRFRHGKHHFELDRTISADGGGTGARFETATLDEEIGAETVLILRDSTRFAHEIQRRAPFELRLKSGVAPISSGLVLCLLWWIPPITNGIPFALYEQILNPANTGTLEGLKQIATQTHLQPEAEDEFLIPQSARPLIDGAVWLAANLVAQRNFLNGC